MTSSHPLRPRAVRRPAPGAARGPDGAFGASPKGADAADGAGWHASSIELREGLEVTENLPLDSLPAEWADSLPPPSA
jgi:hypothetical protein